MANWRDQSASCVEFREARERIHERAETIRATLEIAGLPLDVNTRDALADLAVELERLLVQKADKEDL